MNVFTRPGFVLGPVIVAMVLIGSAVRAAEPSAAPLEPVYQSPWKGYRAWVEPAAIEWRAVNDRVAAVGGWRAYLKQVREAARQESASQPSAVPTTQPAPPAAKPTP